MRHSGEVDKGGETMDSQILITLFFCLTCISIVGIIAIVAFKGGNRINFKAHMSSLEDTKVELEVEDNDIKKE